MMRSSWRRGYDDALAPQEAWHDLPSHHRRRFAAMLAVPGGRGAVRGSPLDDLPQHRDGAGLHPADAGVLRRSVRGVRAMSKPKDEILDNPGFKEFARQFREDVLPKLKQSAHFVAIGPAEGSDADVKMAVELGFAILLDKPIIVLKSRGRTVADKLLRI